MERECDHQTITVSSWEWSCQGRCTGPRRCLGGTRINANSTVLVKPTCHVQRTENVDKKECWSNDLGKRIEGNKTTSGCLCPSLVTTPYLKGIFTYILNHNNVKAMNEHSSREY